MTSRIPSVAGPTASEAALTDGAPLAGYLGADGELAGDPSAALDPQRFAGSNSRREFFSTSSGSNPGLPPDEALAGQVLRFARALEGGSSAAGEVPLLDTSSSSLSNMASRVGQFATSNPDHLSGGDHDGGNGALGKPAVRMPIVNGKCDQPEEPASFTNPVEKGATLADFAGLGLGNPFDHDAPIALLALNGKFENQALHPSLRTVTREGGPEDDSISLNASPPQVDPLIASLMAAALGIAPAFPPRVEVGASPQETSKGPLEALSVQMGQSVASQARQSPSGSIQAYLLGDGGAAPLNGVVDHAMAIGQEQPPQVGSGLTALASGAHAPLDGPASGAIFQRAAPLEDVVKSTDTNFEGVGGPVAPDPELASTIAASILVPALPGVTDLFAPVASPAPPRPVELAWQQVQAMAQRLAVGRGPEAVHQIRVEIDPRLLPGVQAVMQVMAGQLQLEFVCSNEQSRRRLRVVAQREMAGMASRLGCPVQVTLSTAPTSGAGEGGEESPEYLHAQT